MSSLMYSISTQQNGAMMAHFRFTLAVAKRLPANTLIVGVDATIRDIPYISYVYISMSIAPDT